jgi:mycofactocin precursor
MMEKKALETHEDENINSPDSESEEPMILEEIDIEELFIDGICGVY